MGQLYERARVEAVKVKVKFQQTWNDTTGVINGDNGHLAFVVLNEGATLTPAWDNWENYISNNPMNIMDRFIGGVAQSSQWQSMKKYYKLDKFGNGHTSFEADDGFLNVLPATGVMTQNPTRLIQGFLVFLSAGSGGLRNAFAVDFMVEFTFYVRLMKRRLQLA